MSDDEARLADNRLSRRYEFSADATLRDLDKGLALSGVILDLSAGGGLFRLTEPSDLEIGTPVELTVNSGSVTFRALGSVRNCSGEQRLIGMSFESLDHLAQCVLLDLLEELYSAQKPMDAPE